MRPIDIEDIYRRMCEDGNPDHFKAYSFIKAMLEKEYYPYFNQVLPFRTDHGIGHINRILEKLSRFLAPHLPIEGNTENMLIDLENLNLLMHAVLWHDIGNLYGRTNHEKNIKLVYNQYKDRLYGQPLQDWIPIIAGGHSGEGSIEEIEESQKIIHDSVIYPRFLSALLRISDEIDEDDRRIGAKVLSLIPKQNEAYWKFCHCTASIIPIYLIDYNQTLSTLQITIQSKMKTSDLNALWGKNSDQIKGIEEYIFRICKINKERILCNKYLCECSALYFHKINHINIEMDIVDNSNARLDRLTHTFYDKTKYEDFFTDATIREILAKYKE